jgi:hypothetical protein
MDEFQMKLHNITTFYLSVYIEALQRKVAATAFNLRRPMTYCLMLKIQKIWNPEQCNYNGLIFGQTKQVSLVIL